MSNRGRFGALVAAMVFLVAVSITVWPRGGGPKEVVSEYFAAIMAGDADTALGLAAIRPAQASMLSDDGLARQRDVAEITGMQVTGVDKGSANGQVHYRIEIGGVWYADTVAVVRTPSGWKLQSAAVEVSQDVTNGADLTGGGFSIFGNEFVSSVPVYVFPGALEVSLSRGAYFEATGFGTRVPALFRGDQTYRAGAILSGAGVGVAQDAIAKLIPTCLADGSCGSLPMDSTALSITNVRVVIVPDALAVTTGDNTVVNTITAPFWYTLDYDVPGDNPGDPPRHVRETESSGGDFIVDFTAVPPVAVAD